MRRVLKWVGVGFGGLVVLLVVVGAILYFRGSSRIDRNYQINIDPIDTPSSPDAIARGQHLAISVAGCSSCHGANLGGDVLFDDFGFGEVYAPNLTSGRGGVGAIYSDTDWVRAIRHGVDPEGNGLLFMPSDVFHNLSAEDLGAIIAYIKSVPPVDNETPEPTLGVLGKVFVGAGLVLEPVSTELIDHEAPAADSVAPAVSAEYGAYLVSIGHCQVCHGDQLTGGKLDAMSPTAPNLARQGVASRWSLEEFSDTLRTGRTPEGKRLDPEMMPWDIFAAMSDEEIEAIWLYLQSIPDDE